MSEEAKQAFDLFMELQDLKEKVASLKREGMEHYATKVCAALALAEEPFQTWIGQAYCNDTLRP